MILALAVAKGNGTVRLWDLSLGKAIRDIPAAQSTLTGSQAVAFSPDGKWLATATERGRSRLWDVAAGKEIRRFGYAGDPVFCIAFSPGGRRIAGGTYAGVRVWEAATGREIYRHDPLGSPPSSVAFSPDGEWLAFANNQGATLARIPVLAKRKGLTPRKLPPRVGKPVTLTAAQWEKLWAGLADEDAAKAYRAHLTLAAASEQTPRLIARRLRPAPLVTREQQARIERLIADLENRRYAVRRAAARELEEMNELAEPFMQKKLASLPSLELYRRVQSLLKKWERQDPGPRQLRDLRALEVLERIGTPQAVRVLKTLARGAPPARLTHEARAALGRLGDR
jgi:hypothetical protein